MSPNPDQPSAGRLFVSVWIVLAVLFLLPVVLTDHLPMQDVPTHMAIVQTLADEDSTAGWEERFENRLGLKPYVTYYGAGVLLANHFGAEAANRILIAIYVILLPLSFVALVGAVDKTRIWASLFGFTLVYSDLYLLGFTNYLLSLPLVLFASATAIRLSRCSGSGVALTVILFVLSVLTYLTHPLGLAILLLMLATLVPFFTENRRKVLHVVAAMMPSTLLGLFWWIGAEPQHGITRFPVLFKLEYLARTPLMLLENPDAIALFTAIALACLLIGAAIISSHRGGPASSSGVSETIGRRRGTVLVGLLAFVVLYFVAPFALGARIWLDLRLAVFVWFLMFLAWGHRLTARPIGRMLTICLCLVTLLGIFRLHRDFNREIEPLFTVIESAEPQKRILPILLDPASEVIEPFYFSDRVIPFCSPYAHFGSYYHVDKGGISPWMTFWGGLEWVPLGLRNPLYVESFDVKDPFQPLRLLQILPDRASEFDYLLVRGKDHRTSQWIRRFAETRAAAGEFSLYEVR